MLSIETQHSCETVVWALALMSLVMSLVVISWLVMSVVDPECDETDSHHLHW